MRHRRDFIESAIEILRTAREMIRDPRNWCQHALARDGHGRQLDRIDCGDAKAWDASGAVLSAYGLPRWVGPSWEAYAALAHFLPPNVALAQYNDAPGRTHAQMLALFDHAIEYLEATLKRQRTRGKVAA